MKKVPKVLLAFLFVASLIAGCSSENNAQDAGNTQPAQNSQTNEPAPKEEKLEITMMTVSYQGGGWPDQHEMIDFLNEKFNVDLKIQWIPNDTYSEKLNVLAASNDFPDAFYLGKGSFLKYRDRGVFLDVKPLLGNYPNLTKYLGGDAALQFMNPNGKYFGFPFYSIDTRNSLAIRTDWLENLGLEMPTTTDELYNVIKAFTTQDPDKNGENDTYGLTTALSPNKDEFRDIKPLVFAFGLYNVWGVADGKVTSWHAQNKELKEFAAYMKKAYSEGLIDKDFIINKAKDPASKFEAGKVGIVEVVPTNLYTTTVPGLQEIDPKAEIQQLLPPIGPNGNQGTPTNSGTAKIVINAKSDVKKQERILEMFDYFLSDEGNILTKNGIEGVDYKKEGDTYVKLDAFDKNRPYLISNWLIRRADPNITIRLWDDQPMIDKVNKWYENNAPFAWLNVAAGLESETDTKQGKTIDQKFMTALIKIITTDEPVDSIDQAVEEWKKAGGDKITAEYNEAYQQLQ